MFGPSGGMANGAGYVETIVSSDTDAVSPGSTTASSFSPQAGGQCRAEKMLGRLLNSICKICRFDCRQA